MHEMSTPPPLRLPTVGWLFIRVLDRANDGLESDPGLLEDSGDDAASVAFVQDRVACVYPNKYLDSR